ncbi:hypothetical protein [Paenibacillus sp. RC84]|uniref:hypothetical protein n=1 Tax=Paenibacillus sp. RC84 TaxID=3156252 RepID=UPI003513C377
MNNVVKTYINNNLIPLLKRFDTDQSVISKITDDIESRLTSIIYQWNDDEFRSTILFHGIEEANFYVPSLDINIRALVVIGVRNSLLEDMSSTIAAAKSLGLRKPLISDEQIKDITSDAIVFFANQNLKTAARELQKPSNDPFINLAIKYPIAWVAMKNLSQCNNYKSYESQNSTEYSRNLKKTQPNSALCIEVQSGMDSEINNSLDQILENIKAGRQPFFFSDSFKMITRHPDKLYRIMEYVLSAQVPVVTFNYFISNGYVARRSSLLKQAHSERDMIKKLEISNGLRKEHFKIIKMMRQK